MNLEIAQQRLKDATRVAVLTGAGISAESGIPTFREAQTGYWARFSPAELASPEAYRENPERVWDWYAERYRTCQAATPNEAHRALASFETVKGDGFALVTQNVDGLHLQAGSRRVTELHGNLRTARCETCGAVQDLPAAHEFQPPPVCGTCGGRMRPNVVWFGELLSAEALRAAQIAFSRCQVALVVGTSGVVEPAASLGRLAKGGGAMLIEVNPEVTPLSKLCDLRVAAGAVKGLRGLLEPA